MTRINCVPVQELTNKHLVAEYRELPRVFKLARATARIPPKYKMGHGHVTFFYNKLRYLYNRQCELFNEMLARGYKPNYDPKGLLEYEYKTRCWGDWQPDEEALAINRKRIQERLVNGLSQA